MTDRLLKTLPLSDVLVCFANTGKEDIRTLEFIHRCDVHWGGLIHWLEFVPTTPRFQEVTFETASRNGEPFQALLDRREYLPNVVHRYCTQDLKIRVIKRFMLSLGFKHWTNIIGIRYDEPMRWSKVRAIGEKERWETWLPLVEWKVTKPMVLDYWKSMPFDLQLEHYQGNCDLCFLKGRNKLKRLLTETPEKADWWIRQEDAKGATFNKRYSYGALMDLIRTSPTLFDYEDPDFECFCNVD